MYMHNGTTDFLKMLSVLIFIGVAVWWLEKAIGTDYTVLVIFALVGVLLFAGGALLAHANQRQTLDAIVKFNASDAQIDKARLQSFREVVKGESAMQKAAAQLTVLDARRVDKIAEQRAKLLTDAQQQSDAWSWDEEPANNTFQVWE